MRLISPFVVFLFLGCHVYTQSVKFSFRAVPLGVKGGLDESNLSSYMPAPARSNNYVCLDAGTLYAGIKKAGTNQVFQCLAVTKNADKVLHPASVEQELRIKIV